MGDVSYACCFLLDREDRAKLALVRFFGPCIESPHMHPFLDRRSLLIVDEESLGDVTVIPAQLLFGHVYLWECDLLDPSKRVVLNYPLSALEFEGVLYIPVYECTVYM